MWTNGWDPSWSGTGYAREEAAGGSRWGLNIYSSGCVSFMAKLPLTLTHVLEMRGKGRGRKRKTEEEIREKQKEGGGPGWDSKEMGGRETEWSEGRLGSL